MTLDLKVAVLHELQASLLASLFTLLRLFSVCLCLLESCGPTGVSKYKRPCTGMWWFFSFNSQSFLKSWHSLSWSYAEGMVLCRLACPILLLGTLWGRNIRRQVVRQPSLSSATQKSPVQLFWSSCLLTAVTRISCLLLWISFLLIASHMHLPSHMSSDPWMQIGCFVQKTDRSSSYCFP